MPIAELFVQSFLSYGWCTSEMYGTGTVLIRSFQTIPSHCKEVLILPDGPCKLYSNEKISFISSFKKLFYFQAASLSCPQRERALNSEAKRNIFLNFAANDLAHSPFHPPFFR
jgi:hypothetical protein